MRRPVQHTFWTRRDHVGSQHLCLIFKSSAAAGLPRDQTWVKHWPCVRALQSRAFDRLGFNACNQLSGLCAVVSTFLTSRDQTFLTLAESWMVSAVFGVATVVEFVVEGFTYFYDNFSILLLIFWLRFDFVLNSVRDHPSQLNLFFCVREFL